jgi:cytochrome c oxidase subunit 4
MSDHAHDFASEIKRYWMIFGILILGTILTVGAAYVDLGSSTYNIVLALVIATTKASFVALYFMHLISEKTTIYLVLGFTVFFFIGMISLFMGAQADIPTVGG